MTTAHVLGPGVFTIGAGPLAVQAQLTSISVDWSESVKSGDDRDFLDGTSRLGTESATYRASVSGNVLQDDLGAAGFVAYTWTNKGETVPFVFVPNNDLDRRVTGTCVVVPVKIGGEANKENASDFTFRCPVDPVLDDIP